MQTLPNDCPAAVGRSGVPFHVANPISGKPMIGTQGELPIIRCVILHGTASSLDSRVSQLELWLDDNFALKSDSSVACA